MGQLSALCVGQMTYFSEQAFEAGDSISTASFLREISYV
jgi:hypothetical protein